MKTQSQIFWAFLSALPSWDANIQVKTTSKVKNPRCVSCVTAGVGHHKEGVGIFNAIVQSK